jgi:selenobiotic family peptide radical SAM maturase
MRPSGTSQLQTIYPTCHAFLDSNTWNACVAEYTAEQNARSLEEFFTQHIRESGLPEFLPGLARLEHAIDEARHQGQTLLTDVGRREINPTLSLIDSAWKDLPAFIDSRDDPPRDPPQQGEERILVWYHPKTETVRYRPATDEDLLVLKMIAEDIDPRVVAKEGRVPPVAVEDAIDRVAADGLVLKPRPLIRRDRGDTEAWRSIDERFIESSFFTIQWHITQACDLHCRHCYDRSRRSPLTLEAGIDILDDLATFCTSRHVRGQVSFSGGNPLLHPHFFDLYRAASERGFVTAILGNPTSRENLERIVEIQTPSQYQVSLEGLEEYNDYIRGDGNSRDVMAFLPILRSLGITAQVMLTLTRDNIDQVVPLAEILRNQADSFTFNRLSQVGEGAGLAIPSRDKYQAFLIDYVEAAKTNPVMGLKDNLTNIIFHQRGEEIFGGCAGYGCSAAFNFIAILPDGEAHACRKFPSYIGDVYHQSIGEIYDSAAARRYRAGTEACRSCPIRPVCGGCLAVMYGQGLDIFAARDPHCFM